MTVAERLALAAMSESEIRRAQEIVFAQQRSAYAHRNTRALERLNEWERNYADELFRRLMEDAR